MAREVVSCTTAFGEEHFAICNHTKMIIYKIPRCEIIFVMFYQRFIQSTTLRLGMNLECP